MAVSNKQQIKYYPVDNGDMSLITLTDKTTILVDCNIRETAKGDSNEDLFDAHDDLLNSIQKDKDGILYVDVFILTHGDQDHCRGFEKNFYQGNPSKYNETDKENKLIRVDAMWFSPMIAEEHANDDEEAYQKEAERRLKLHRNGDPDKDKPGNRIRIIGYDGNKKYEDLEHIRSTPGKIVSRFNDKEQDTFSVFIHSPFKEQLTSATKDKNSTSIVFQARFKEKKEDNIFITLAMFGGDSDHIAWDTILSKTKKSGKDKSDEALNWDLFLAPHHCSWSFFNDRPQNENSTPTKTSLEVLDYANKGAYVIASSKKIVDDGKNPPHYEAKQEYIAKLESASKFLNTAIDPSDKEPIVFDITSNGPAIPPKSNLSGSLSSAGGGGSAATIITQG